MNPNDNSTGDSQVPVAPQSGTSAPVTQPEPMPATQEVEETVAAPEPMEEATQSADAPVSSSTNVSAPAASTDPAAVLTEESSDAQNG